MAGGNEASVAAHSLMVAALLALPASACDAPSPTTTPVHASSTASATPLTSPTPPPCSNASVLATWSTERLAEQTLTVPASETDVVAVRTEIASGAGGVILFGASAPSNLAAQLQTLVAAAPSGVPPLVMTDEEGGAVQRMANLVGSIPSARQMAATMTAAQIEQLADGLATRMRMNGITMDLAPVLDLDGGTGPSNTDPDGTRSFSTDEAVASSDGLAFAEGLRAGGILAVVKHFPGLGDATGNTDVSPAASQPWAQLQSDALLPFSDAVTAGVPAVMVSNASVPGLTTLPASISPSVITGVLRLRLGFQGLVMTDSLSAGALADIGYTVPRATVAALQAGADMVLFTADQSQVAAVTQQTVNAIVAAVSAGSLPMSALIDAAAHVLAAKGVDLCVG